MSPINRTLTNPFGIQASASQYLSGSYLSPKRFSSIGWQLNLSLELDADRYLDVGSGNSILAYLLRKQDKSVFSIDHNLGSIPDVQAIFPFLPFCAGVVDACLCFQVLEHLPYSLVREGLAELARVSKKYIVISLPDQTEELSGRQRFARRVYQTFRFPLRWKPPSRQPDPEHFWEIGMDGILPEDIIRIAQMCQLTVKKNFRNPLFVYHHFFVFEKLR